MPQRTPPPRPPIPTKVVLADKFALFHDHWHPRIIGEVNDHQVKLAKLQGEFVWHRHDHEDELFLVVTGQLTIRFRDGNLTLRAGELVVVPRGVEHQPVAAQEVEVLLFEPKGTVNTGEVRDERTVDRPESI